jgi:hypothetical protein
MRTSSTISTAALRPAAIGNETADAGALKAFRQLRLAISSKRHQVSRSQQHEPQSLSCRKLGRRRQRDHCDGRNRSDFDQTI